MVFCQRVIFTQGHSFQFKILSKIIKEEQISGKLDLRATFIKTQEHSESLKLINKTFYEKRQIEIILNFYGTNYIHL